LPQTRPHFSKYIFFLIAFVAFPGNLAAFAPPTTEEIPESISAWGKKFPLKELKNPLRDDAGQLQNNLKAGQKIYFEKCFLCHGDLLDGNGLYGKSFFPPAANFTSPKSILTKPDSYAFWRITKGGPGLPEKHAPWDSAMPAWESQLQEEDVWQVLLYIVETAGEIVSKQVARSTESSTEIGRQLYMEKCAICHGETGAGDGLTKDISSPKPRNFVKGQYKFRSVKFGKIPTDQDLFDMITQGMKGTTMPAWRHLPETDRWSLVLYLKTLSKKFAKAKKRNKYPKVIPVPDPPGDFNTESIASGKELFLQNCSGCHGVKGRSDGVSTFKVVDVASDAIWPRNLSKSWLFRRGTTRKDIFQTLRTGLSTTAMPQFSTRVFKDSQIWDIVNYVQTLSAAKQPAINPLIKATKVEGGLPLDPDDKFWNSIDAYYFPLGRQVIQGDKAYLPAIDDVTVKAVYNTEEIAFYIHWDDPRVDAALIHKTVVEESPAPPLPPELRSDDDEEEEEVVRDAQKFADAIAIQFPIKPNANGAKPYFLNGDANHPVNLWKLDTASMHAVEVNARGMESWTPQADPSQNLAAKIIYKYGRYSAVVKRKLATGDTENDIQFIPGMKTPIAFNAWDGTQGDTGSKKSISSWFQLVLE